MQYARISAVNGSGLLIGVLTGGFALAGVAGSHWLLGRRDRKADERALRDANRERLRREYVELLRASRAVRDRAKAFGWFSGVSSVKERLDEQDVQLFSSLEHSLAALRLEDDVAPVLEIFEELSKAYRQYRAALERIEKPPHNKEAYAKLHEAYTEIEANVPLIEKLARSHLARLSEPI